MEQSGAGRKPAGDGWFVVNARDAEWLHNERFGAGVIFESVERRFPHYGINVQVLWPGQPNGYYHAEDGQEDFLILSGECLLLIEGEERRLKAWDFVHCPPWTEHTFVGAGDGPCVIVMAGSRADGFEVVYPVNELAATHDASVLEETSKPDEAYARWGAEGWSAYREGWLPGGTAATE
jgi:uncharacterized cupin superfamily protein